MISRKWDLFEVKSHFLRRGLDLQYESIFLELRKLARVNQPFLKILDFGCGSMPWKRIFKNVHQYTGIDSDSGLPGSYKNLNDIPGRADFDIVLAIEVLEHLSHPIDVLKRLAERINDGGVIVVSVPWASRVHRAPDDFQRWTPQGLNQLFVQAGLEIEYLAPRGSDLTVLCSKLVLALSRRLLSFWYFPIALPFSIIMGIPAILLGHFSLRMKFGFEDDPLGYFVVLRKRRLEA